jgi:Cu/Ag efflux pump CusA
VDFVNSARHNAEPDPAPSRANRSSYVAGDFSTAVFDVRLGEIVFLILLNLLTAPIGGLLALVIPGTHFSVSSGVGFLVLFGVSVQVGVIMVECINQLRARVYDMVTPLSRALFSACAAF